MLKHITIDNLSDFFLPHTNTNQSFLYIHIDAIDITIIKLLKYSYMFVQHIISFFIMFSEALKNIWRIPFCEHTFIRHQLKFTEIKSIAKIGTWL